MSTTTTQTQTQQSKFGVDHRQVQTIEVPRGTTTSSLVFYAPPSDGSSPFNYVEKQPEGQLQRNYGEDSHTVSVHDIRGHEENYNINTQGFGTIRNAPVLDPATFDSDDLIQQQYYPEVEKLLLDNVPGSHRIFIFDHTVRRSDPNAARAPVNRAHIDQTQRSAIARVHHHLPEEADELLKGRYRLINVWRPLKGPVVASPLAYADSRSVPDEDVVPVEHRYPHRTGETAGVKYTESGKWHYWSGMTEDERILLQCFDSKDGARTPHSAFVDPRTRPEWPGRESIEVRALVFG